MSKDKKKDEQDVEMKDAEKKTPEEDEKDNKPMSALDAGDIQLLKSYVSL